MLTRGEQEKADKIIIYLICLVMIISRFLRFRTLRYFWLRRDVTR